MSPRPRKAKRDYAAEYARRQAKARALGYESYYARRVRAGAPPSAPRPSGERLRRARGHAGRADLVRTMREGDLIVLQTDISSIRVDAAGRYERIEILLIPADGRAEQRWVLRKISEEQLRGLVEAQLAAGAIFSPAPSLDLRRLAAEAPPDEDEEEEYDFSDADIDQLFGGES